MLRIFIVLNIGRQNETYESDEIHVNFSKPIMFLSII